MRYLYYCGLTLWALFEFLNVYFIMPMPGSQTLDAVGLAYVLYRSRWIIRLALVAAAASGAPAAFRNIRAWKPSIPLVLSLAICWVFNFRLNADHMFLQPGKVRFADSSVIRNDSTLVLTATLNGEYKAWPMRYLIYHHQVKDTLAGRPILVTYCSVCRTGRVFEPVVNGEPETFRLVGMSRFNAMLEDSRTGSWWRQANGEAITGPLTGTMLPEVESRQMTAGKFFQLHPDGLMMLPDEDFKQEYDSLGRYEKGKSKSALTRSDTASWQEKSWVIGIAWNGIERAYDWNQLKRERMLRDRVGEKPMVLLLSLDNQSFGALALPSNTAMVRWSSDTLYVDGQAYSLEGRNFNSINDRLPAVPAYQEFWHSWRTFHPKTGKYGE